MFNKNKFIDCHTHTFIMKHVPPDYLPFNLYYILNNLFIYNAISVVGTWIIPFKGDIIDRAIKFIKFSRTGNQHRIFEKFLKSYPEIDSFVVLTMDFEHIGLKKKEEISFLDQLLEIKKLKDIYGDKIIPFIMADPRRDGIFDLTKKAINEWGFKGVKLYPPLGYTINDFSDEYLKWLEDNQIPIITHCSTNAATYYRGKDIQDLINKKCHFPSEILKYDDKSDKEKSDLFSFPLEYGIALEKFPNLRLDIAHFGGNAQWDIREKEMHDVWSDHIIKLCTKYPNVYTDISYLMYEEKRHGELLKIMNHDLCMKNKILFGTDYYLVELDEYNIKNFYTDLIKNIGGNNFNRLLLNNIEFLKV